MTEQRRNSYSEEDLAQLVGEIEEVREDSADIMASARGKVMNNKKREKNLITMAEKELGIPPKIAKAALRQRELERQMKKNAESVGDDLIEMYVEASGQMSLFKPVEGALAATPGEAAAVAARAEIQRVTDEEQAEGEAVFGKTIGGEED